MNRKRIVQRSPIVVWSGVAVLFGIGIAYTPALGNGSTWTFPYAGIANSYSDVFDITNTGTGAAMWGYATSEYQGALNGKNYSAGGYGVQGLAYAAAGYGVAGIGAGAGLAGTGVGTGSRGVTGSGNQYGVYGSATDSGSVGVYGTVSGNGVGVEGVVSTSSNIGVEGLGSNSGLGVYAQSDTGNAFEAYTSNSTYACIYAYSKATGVGTFSYSASTGDGVYGIGGVGIHGGTTGQGSNLAGKFDGNVQINGNLNVTGTINKSAVGFKIDHPMDPAHKYLMHSCVESDEMMNLYRGNVLLDSEGKATVSMPAWFQAENTDCNYQLTCVGKPAQVYIEQEITHNQFRIAGGAPGMKVCWVVTGVRNDAYAQSHPLNVEVEKSAAEQGKYIRPEEFGQPATKAVGYTASLLPNAPKGVKASIVAPLPIKDLSASRNAAHKPAR